MAPVGLPVAAAAAGFCCAWLPGDAAAGPTPADRERTTAPTTSRTSAIGLLPVRVVQRGFFTLTLLCSGGRDGGDGGAGWGASRAARAAKFVSDSWPRSTHARTLAVTSAGRSVGCAGVARKAASVPVAQIRRGHLCRWHRYVSASAERVASERSAGHDRQRRYLAMRDRRRGAPPRRRLGPGTAGRQHL